MLPKVIHYCWFGRNPLPKVALLCIDSWKKYCPDYQIILWNEDNFDISANPYMREAYNAGKYAFVTDLARLIIIYEHGGIYLDTDVKLLKPLDELLAGRGYFGFQSIREVNTGLGFGAEKAHPLIKMLIDSYNGVHFLKPDGSYDTTPCPERNTACLISAGLKPDGTDQCIDGIRFLPKEYLCPTDWETGLVHITDRTISNHLYAASWHTTEDKRRNKAKQRKQRMILLLKKWKLYDFAKSLRRNLTMHRGK